MRPGSTLTFGRALLAVAAAQHRAFREFGFSMALGDLLTGSYPKCLVAVYRPGRRLIGFQRYGPCWQGYALSLDPTCRLPGAPGGANERMIVKAVGWAAATEPGKCR